MGPITALLVTRLLSLEQQGYYYTLNSLIGISTFGDLGFSLIVIQFASHEWSRLRLNPGGAVTGDARSLNRLGDLKRLALRYYSVASLACSVPMMGAAFASLGTGGAVPWIWPWVSLCALVILNQFTLPFLSLVEGCNQISFANGVRLFAGIAGSLGIWVGLVSGARLWSITFGYAASAVVPIFMLSWRYRGFFRSLTHRTAGRELDWRQEFWPMQWRVSLIYVSGFLAASLYVPVCFRVLGAAVAAQVGLTLVLVQCLSALSQTWAQALAPTFGMLIVKQDRVTLDRLFGKVWWLTTLTAVAGALAILALVAGLHHYGFALYGRLLPERQSALFLAASCLSLMTTPWAFYLRAHKREYFLAPSVFYGVGISVLLIPLARWGGITAIGWGYLGITAILLPWCYLIFRNARQELAVAPAG